MQPNEDRPTRDDRDTFLEAVTGVLDADWPSAVTAETGDITSAVEALEQLGVSEFADMGAYDFLFDLVETLGGRALPTLTGDLFVASLLDPELSARITAGEVHPVAHFGAAQDRVVAFGATSADHVLFLDPAAGTAALAPVTANTPAAGREHLAAAVLQVGAALPLNAGVAAVARAVEIVLLIQASSVSGATRRAHELAVEHAKTRHQFGRAIGAFGAVQQRIAACQIDVSANTALIAEAVAALALGSQHTSLPALLAVRHVADRATGIIAGAQHTLGAIGYFDEHEMAWLFRFVHAEISQLRTRLRAVPTASTLEARLLDRGDRLPAFELGDAAELLRQQVRTLLDTHRGDDGYDVEGVRTAASEAGLFSLSWPLEEGGAAATLEEQVVLNEEMKYAGGPVDRAMSATMLIGHALLRHGTPEQRAAFLPLLRNGQMNFCLGYSEPEAGSDLASLRTRATPDGDDWVISGQKLWTTRAQTASHVWLAVRTDADAKPRHAGITIFLVPMDTPGITITEHVALSGEISCTVFYDDVRVPDSTRVGEINGGWKVITDALAAERVVMGGIAATLLGHFDALIDWVRAQAAAQAAPLSAVDRDAVASVAARLQAARALVLAATRAMSGDDARIIGPVAAVLSGDLAEQFARTALNVVGDEAFDPASPTHRFEELLRLAPMFVIGGGTNDIQRGIIARSLGLPRE